VERYRKRISGPILDRIDLHVSVKEVRPTDLENLSSGETSLIIRQKIQAARERQTLRFKGTKIVCNADMGIKAVKSFCKLSAECSELVTKLSLHYRLSARAHVKLIKVARTIADLAGDDNILPTHLLQAVRFRQTGSISA
jgi:magnesium chelatase family protein